jgi:hypothetical protein
VGRRRRCFGAATACALGTWALASPALATPSAKLTYLRGPGAERCPDEAELRKAVAARLGYDLFFPWATKTVVAEISKARKGFHGRVKIVDEQGLVRGERAIDATSDDCGDVMRALALAISIAVDDFDLDAAPPPTPAPPPAPVPPLAPEPPEVLEPPAGSSLPPRTPERPAGPATDSGPPRGFEVEAWLTPLVSAGVAPQGSLGVIVGAGALYHAVSLGLEARGDLPASGGDAPSGRVRTFVLLGSLVPCFHEPSPLFVCGLVSAGTFQEQGEGLRAPRSGAAPFGAVGGRFGVELPLSRLAFFVAHADGLATLTRHTVQIDGQGAFTLPPFSASIGFGAGVRF